MTPTPRTSQNGHMNGASMGNGQGNGNFTNGQTSNGHGGNGQGPSQVPAQPARQPVAPAFDRPVVLRQSPRWARYVVWGIVGVTASTITWACIAQIEEAVPAQGKLEPRGVVQPVQAPVGGVVEEILVQEGETVEKGDVLITLDPRATQAELDALLEVQKSLVAENSFYRSQFEDSAAQPGTPETVSAETSRLTSNRAALIKENQLYSAILSGGITADNISADQQARLRAAVGNLESRLSINDLEAGQLAEQLAEVQLRLDNAVEALKVETDILGRISPLVAEGAIAELQEMRQAQEVNNRRTEVDSLREERDRLRIAIRQAREQRAQTAVSSEEDLRNRIAANQNQIANIDSQLTKIIVENEKRLEEINGQVSRLEFALENQELEAPLAGQVFNLKANQPGYVANATEPILEIVPNDTLVARVDVTNRDIGFVTQQFYQPDSELKVDVRIDSFPFSEFGDVEGTVVHIASDAMPPDEINPFFRFPVEIELESQTLGDTLPLQSGMSVSANIKLRKRRVITILSDLFVRKLDSLRNGG